VGDCKLLCSVSEISSELVARASNGLKMFENAQLLCVAPLQTGEVGNRQKCLCVLAYLSVLCVKFNLNAEHAGDTQPSQRLRRETLDFGHGDPVNRTTVAAAL
jgi:hypothetical protein